MEHQVKELADLFKFCQLMPKTELHAHLNGSIRKSTLFELLNESDRDELSALYSNQMSFENAFKVFRISSKIVTSLDVIKRITREMIEDWNKLNCIYLEIRTSVKAICGKTKEDYLRTVLEEIKVGNSKCSMKTRLIISLNRELPLEDYLETLKVYENFQDSELKKLIVGIDYSGYEVNEKHTYESLVPIFQKFRDYGLKVTIHMGECKVYQKLGFKLFKPDRVSHTYFFTSEECADIMSNKIPIEVCPTGSYSIKNLTSYKDITFNNYHKKVVKEPYNNEDYEYDLICINTDDTMIFCTDIAQEYFEVCHNFGIDKEEIKKIVLNTINFIFDENEEVRNELRQKIINFKY